MATESTWPGAEQNWRSSPFQVLRPSKLFRVVPPSLGKSTDYEINGNFFSISEYPLGSILQGPIFRHQISKGQCVSNLREEGKGK